MPSRTQPIVVTVVAVVTRAGDDRVVLEADRRAADLDTDLHVVYVLGLSAFGTLELDLAERVGIPVGMDLIRDRCAAIAEGIAASVADDYEPVGLVGDPAEEVLEYARRVKADRIVIDSRRSRWNAGPFGGSKETLRESDVLVVPVY